ncbi:MAG: malonyl-ACP O-methyltransferase BioC [Armatimonadetes bacterium]|nr:malonyl-ACP O-methyltransferase BioC [Armatimonadota bacterium]
MAEVEIIRAFSDAACSYEQNAAAQRDCALDLMDMLLLRYPDAEAAAPARALDIGCGTGFFTRMLAERFPDAQILACDPSQKMLKKARQSSNNANIEFMRCNIENLPEERWDLIASNAALHWAGNAASVLAILKDHLAPNGTLAFSYFTRNTYRELTEALSHAAGFEVKLPSADFASADELEEILSEQFTDVRAQRKVYTQEFADIRALMEHVKLTGTRGAGSRPRLRWTKRLLETTQQEYISRFGCIRASYEVVICTAKQTRSL